MSAQPVRAVFLDRDGVLNDPALDPVDGRFESPLHAGDVVLAEGAIEGCRMLREAGFLLLVASNQPAAAKAKATREQLREVHERVVSLLAAGGVTIDDWRYCLHHPEATVPELRGDPCGCRKPARACCWSWLKRTRSTSQPVGWSATATRISALGSPPGAVPLGDAPGLRAPSNGPSSTCRIGTNLSPAAALICS